MTSELANTPCRLRTGAGLAIFFLFFIVPTCSGYSVIMHEAIVDAEWDYRIVPFLRQHFPNATSEELRQAKSYAYGGSVIQDLGYYPLGSHFFSHLTHYVRTGDFVQALFQESKDINDYAFALGALSHYSADIKGHSVGINRAVPLLYPRLRRKYGDIMTWEDSPYAHLLTEFGFDTLEVVAGHVAPQKYHEWVGFRVPKPVLQRAFRRTYGLELKDQVLSTRLTLAAYRVVASRFIPEMTEVAWALKRKTLEQRADDLHHKSLFHLRHANIEASWEKTRTRPRPGDYVTAWVFRILPKVGPLNVFQFHPPTEQTAQLFGDSLKATAADYEVNVGAPRFDPPDINLDTGKLIRPGDYRYCDGTFAKLLHQLARTDFGSATPALRQSLLGFYSDSSRNTVRRKRREWRRVTRDLEQLKAAPSG
jgi:hypothetical protein